MQEASGEMLGEDRLPVMVREVRAAIAEWRSFVLDPG